MFAFAGNIWVLFFARLLDGISGGNIPIANAYMADITPKEKRAEGMGIISGAMSLGFVIGPVVGGVLGQYGMVGLLMAYRGAISSVVQLFLVGRVLGYLSYLSVLRITITMMMVGLVITGWAPNIVILLIGLTVMELGGDFIGPIIMGVTASLSALGRTAGPYFGGASFEILGASYPFYWGAILMGAGLMILR